MTGLEKAALLLRSLGDQTVSTVLAKLNPEQAKRVRAQMEQLGKGPDVKRAMRDVMGELEQALQQDAPAPHGQPASDRVDHVVKDEPPPQKSLPDDPLQAIRALPSDKLARALHGENPRTVSLLLNTLEVPQAGEIFKKLPSTLRREVSVQFARQTMPAPEVMRRIAQGVVQKAEALGDAAVVEDGDRVKKMSSMLRLLERAERTEMLAALTEKEPDMAQKVKGELYQFEDILLLDNPSCQKLLGELDTKTLAMALRNVKAEIEQKILTNLSKRAQETLRDEMELLGQVPGSKQAAARKSMVESLQKLDERGELTMLE